MKEIQIDVRCPICSSHEIVFLHPVVAAVGSLRYRYLSVEPLWEPDLESEAWCPQCEYREILYDFLLDEPW